MLARHREALAAAAAAAVVAALLVWLGPPGTDFAAHAYQLDLFRRHGFTLWDNYWYAGRYAFVGYSVLYYPLAALLGIRLLAVLSIAVGALAFAEVVDREWGAATRWGGRAFAILWAGFVLTAAFPFMLGFSLAVCALWALQTRRRVLFPALVLLTLAASPVALVLLGVVLLGVSAVRGRRLVPLLAVALAGAIELVLLELFPNGGHYPFPASEAGAALGFCAGVVALTWRVERARLLGWIFAAYALAISVVWAFPATLGENVARLRYVAFPIALLALGLRRWRPIPVAAVVAAAALAWNVAPLAEGWNRGTSDPMRFANSWAFTIRYLKDVQPRPQYRVEAVDTTGHWPAYYLAKAGIPLVRGWFRQDDFPTNAILYRRFTGFEYLRWLRSLGVYFVVLSDAPADYSSRAEAQLIRSGRSGLHFWLRHGKVTLYKVPHPQRIITGPGGPRLIRLRLSKLSVWVPQAGTYRIAVHWSRWWHASSGRLSRSADGMIDLHAPGPEDVFLSFRFP
jgi:hypothetical protein